MCSGLPPRPSFDALSDQILDISQGRVLRAFGKLCVFRRCQLAFEAVQKLIDDPPLAIGQARARELIPKTSLCQNSRQRALRILNRAAEAIQKPSQPIRDIERALLGRFEHVIVHRKSKNIHRKSCGEYRC
jgi:hypothetical protein